MQTVFYTNAWEIELLTESISIISQKENEFCIYLKFFYSNKFIKKYNFFIINNILIRHI